MASLTHKWKLLRVLMSGEAAAVGPLVVMADLTRRCNLRCPGCLYHSPLIGAPSPGDQGEADLSPALFRQLCRELKPLGTEEMILTGDGEPLLHPGLTEIIAAAVESGFRTTLLTNGTLLAPEIGGALLDSGLHALTVSLWASSAEDYAGSYPGSDPALFHTVADNLARVARMRRERRSRRPRIRLHQPINRSNWRGIGRMVDLACDTGADGLSFAPFRSRRGRLEPLALRPEEIGPLQESLRAADRRLRKRGLESNIGHALGRYDLGEHAWRETPCYAGWMISHIKPDGSVFFCNSLGLSMGSLRQEPFAAIWNGPAYQRLRRSMGLGRGPEASGVERDCGYCGQLPDNRRIHRIFRHLRPFARSGGA